MLTLSQRYNARFFYRHGAYSWSPTRQTQEEGHRECARDMAKAWRWGKKNLSYSWTIDLDPDRSGIAHNNYIYICTARNADGIIEASLGGIDLGEHGHPDTENYARVVEAELAMEAMPS